MREAPEHLTKGGRVLFGTGNFGDVARFKRIAQGFGYSINLLAKEDSVEINPIDFQLYELRKSQ